MLIWRCLSILWGRRDRWGIERFMTPEVVELLDLDSTASGDGGFGSTGV
ncbi:unnamed protein product [Musa acuminata subsp. malaccensis]|uniref:(wild Malaysian banana) hypothetical protein n=1 Tax=Musa acuminata subsp. malaccensis TaxID=214687 RepID=A0A804JN75_MUSAM|nr:unnamed protein product [Musa acuminata subsp. malaccensis]